QIRSCLFRADNLSREFAMHTGARSSTVPGTLGTRGASQQGESGGIIYHQEDTFNAFERFSERFSWDCRDRERGNNYQHQHTLWHWYTILVYLLGYQLL
ncbi:MAG: hypothetical protein ACRD34_14035, partial [Bryobacteraceae bacterium]